MFYPERSHPEQFKQLQSMNCTYRFSYSSPSYKKDGKEVVEDDTKPGPMTYCEIIDNTLGGDPETCGFVKVAIEGVGGGQEIEAFVQAVAKAIDAPKPMTPAQKVTMKKSQDEINALKAELAELRGKVGDSKPVKGKPAAAPAL